MNKAQQDSANRIRRAAQSIEALVLVELKRFSQKRKHDLEKTHTTLSLHATRLHLQVPKLSRRYDPSQYLEHARNVLSQLLRLEGFLRSGPSAFEGQGWRVQPEESVEIDYQAFHNLYGCSRADIDGLREIIQHYYPNRPIQNSTIEWAVLRQRDRELQDMAGQAE